MFTITTFSAIAKTTAIAQESLNSIEKLKERILSYETAVVNKKEDNKLFSFATFPEKDEKTSMPIRKNGVSSNVIVLDIDEINDQEAFKKNLTSILTTYPNKAIILYETVSSTSENPKYRIICPFDRQLNKEEFKKITARFEILFDVKADIVSKTVGQPYYYPARLKKNTQNILIDAVGTEIWTEADLPQLIASVTKLSSKPSKSDEKDIDIVIQLAQQLQVDNIPSPIYCSRSQRIYVCINAAWGYMNEETYAAWVYKYLSLDSPKLVYSSHKASSIHFYHESFPESNLNMIQLNGSILDIDNGKNIPNNSSYYLKRYVNVVYDATATCPQWLKFLDESFAGTDDAQERVNLLQEFMGYTLLDSKKYGVMLWLYGNGNNGKSVVLNVLRELLGLENTSSTKLESLKATGFSYSTIDNKMLNISDELDADARLDWAGLKQVITEEYLQIEYKGQTAKQAKNSCKLIAAMNNLPNHHNDLSHGFTRRLRIIHFPNTPVEVDTQLKNKLLSEKAGILNWMLEGCSRSADHNTISNPASSQKLLTEVINSNPVARFVSLYLLKSDTHKTPLTDIISLYNSWARMHAIPPHSNSSQLGKTLTQLGIESVKSNGYMHYKVTPNNMIRKVKNSYGDEEMLFMD